MTRIRRGLSSRNLPCGCLVGIYETYNDETVAVIDVRGGNCSDPAHSAGNTVPIPLSPETLSTRHDRPHR